MKIYRVHGDDCPLKSDAPHLDDNRVWHGRAGNCDLQFVKPPAFPEVFPGPLSETETDRPVFALAGLSTRGSVDDVSQLQLVIDLHRSAH